MIDFLNVSFEPADEYKEFILSHDNAVATERSAWVKAAEAGHAVIPYCEHWMNEDESIVYFEFVDDEANIYVDFFNDETEEWIESYKFKDKEMSWTIGVDNWFYGNPLKIAGVPDIWGDLKKKGDPDLKGGTNET